MYGRKGSTSGLYGERASLEPWHLWSVSCFCRDEVVGVANMPFRPIGMNLAFCTDTILQHSITPMSKLTFAPPPGISQHCSLPSAPYAMHPSGARGSTPYSGHSLRRRTSRCDRINRRSFNGDQPPVSLTCPSQPSHLSSLPKHN